MKATTTKPTTLYGGLITVEPLLCCLCGKGVEAGKLVGTRINDMVHGDCLVGYDPFAERLNTIDGTVR